MTNILKFVCQAYLYVWPLYRRCLTGTFCLSMFLKHFINIFVVTSKTCLSSTCFYCVTEPTNIVLDKQNFRCLPKNVCPFGRGFTSRKRLSDKQNVCPAHVKPCPKEQAFEVLPVKHNICQFGHQKSQSNIHALIDKHFKLCLPSKCMPPLQTSLDKHDLLVKFQQHLCCRKQKCL